MPSTPRSAPACCRLRAEVVKNSVAPPSGVGPVAASMIRSTPSSAAAEALAGDHVDAVPARDRHHLVPALAQDLDGGAAEAAGRTGDGDLLLYLPWLLSFQSKGRLLVGRFLRLIGVTEPRAEM